jgi:hypothetical protein
MVRSCCTAPGTRTPQSRPRHPQRTIIERAARFTILLLAAVALAGIMAAAALSRSLCRRLELLDQGGKPFRDRFRDRIIFGAQAPSDQQEPSGSILWLEVVGHVSSTARGDVQTGQRRCLQEVPGSVVFRAGAARKSSAHG